MRRLICAVCLFCAGRNFERMTSGLPDALFGVYWLLPILVLLGLAAGWNLMPAHSRSTLTEVNE